MKSLYLDFFIIEFIMRDDRRFLKYAYRWKDGSPEERDDIETQRGVSWSTFDALPGWMPARDSPVDFMHAVFLGQSSRSLHNLTNLFNAFGTLRGSQTHYTTNHQRRRHAHASKSDKQSVEEVREFLGIYLVAGNDW